MEKNRIILWSILIFVIIALIAMVICILIRYSKITKINKKFKNAQKEFEDKRVSHSQIKMDKLLSRNDLDFTFMEVVKNLSDLYNKAFEFEKKANELIEEYSQTSLIKNKKQILENFIIETNSMFEIEIQFKNKSDVLFNKQNFLNKKLNLFQKLLRKTTEEYANTRVMLDDISDAIDKKLDSLNTIKNKISYFISTGVFIDASNTLITYREKVLEIINIIDQARKIKISIDKNIKDEFNNLADYYQETIRNKNISLHSIGFKTRMKEIKQRINKAKTYYLELEFDNAKTEIIKIFKNISHIKIVMEQEIESKNIIDTFKIDFDNINEQLVTNIESLEVSIKSLGTDSKYLEPFMNELNTLKKTSVFSLVETYESLQSVMDQKNIPYLSQISKIKMLLETHVLVLKKINNLNKRIQEVDNVRIRHNNRFIKLSNSINELRYQVTKNNLFLTPEDKEVVRKLEQTRVDIAELIVDKDRVLKDERGIDKFINTLEKSTINFYKLFSIKLKVSEMTMFLFNKCSKYRYNDAIFNQRVVNAERKHLEGDYIGAADMLINALEMGHSV